MAPAIQIDQLTKTFSVRLREPGLGGALRSLVRTRRRDVVAVDAIDLAIAAGQRVAFVGPNGAGKSTTIKMLSGILRPTHGCIRVAGCDPTRDRKTLAYRIGTVFGQRSQLWHHLPAADTFALLAAVYDQDRATHRLRMAKLVDAFDIGGFIDRPVRELSLGQRMRCEIVASLLHAPQVLFLDEPTIGLDVAAKATIRDLVREQAEDYGRTVLLTSHDTADMERVCDRVVVIHSGRILLDASVDGLRRQFIRRKLITVRTVEESVDVEIPGVTWMTRVPHRGELEVDLELTTVQAVIETLLRATRIHDLTVSDPPMDEVVAAIYRRADANPHECVAAS